jgi:arginine-tRNA-protein transferase
VPVRIDAGNFQPSRNLRRISNANADLAVHEQRSVATREQYDLFARYLASRHGDGEMADMDFDNYQAMVDDTALHTSLVEFRDPEGALVAACLTDWLIDGPSAVYSFFDPALGRRSLGSYMILWLVEAARARGLPYVYLGYWVEGAEKMDYKRRFRPLQGLQGGKWREIA